MKNIILKLGMIVSVGMLVISCSDLTELHDDPNETSTTVPQLILTTLEEDAFANNVSESSALTNRYMVFCETSSEDQYYTWQTGSLGYYDDIKQAMKMSDESERIGDTIYNSLSKFFKSYFIIEMTQDFGDLPYSQVGKLDEGITKPVYDSQKSIYLKVLNDLKSASDALASSSGSISSDNDVIYRGDKTKWRKLIDSYYLRVLMDLSKKTNDADLQIIQRFNSIVNNPSQYPIFTSNSDNGDIQYSSQTSNHYPGYYNNDLQCEYYMEKTFVDRLKNLQDPRLFKMASMTNKAVANGLSETDFNSYNGALGSAPLGDIEVAVSSGNVSIINSRYFLNIAAEPGVLMNYSELEFILAEASERGWITAGKADSYYKAGITASMNFYNITDASTINNYINQPAVSLTNGDPIEQIMIQKHISMFMNTGWQIFFDQRRTGYPVYDVSGSGIGNNGLVPQRWMYPSSEYTHNSDNVKSAVKSQYSGNDNINGVMWVLK
jgi:hypothetical protein